MLSKKQKEDFYIFAQDSLKLADKFILGTDTLTPVNYNEEKEKFFASKTYNPQFMYVYRKRPNLNMPLLEMRLRLNRLEIPDDLKVYVHEFLNDIKLIELTIRAVGTSRFPYYVEKLFDWGKYESTNLLSTLPKISYKKPTQEKLFSAFEMKEIFEHYLEKQCGITDYLIHIDGFNDHTVRVGDKRLVIGKKVKRGKQNVERLIVHEIESHILQRHNILNANNPLLNLLKLSDWRLYGEGLAVYNEIMTGTITKSAHDTYIARLKAVEMREKSFRDIFSFLANSFSPEKAFVITFRIKRGMGDTGMAGGFPKDAAYLLGFKAISDYKAKEGKINLLYLCRVPRLLNLLRKYDLMPEMPTTLPSFMDGTKNKDRQSSLREEFLSPPQSE